MFSCQWLHSKGSVGYEETFFPVAKIVTICIIITIVFNKNWTLHQFDINNAFLYGELEEDVCMTLPLGYHSKNSTRVCKLLKFLHGLAGPT